MTTPGDQDVRREQIAQALWQVVRRDGIGGITVDDVAVEAGISADVVRSVFPDREELTGFAMDLVARRVQDRIESLAGPPTGTATQIVLRYLDEMIPLDPERLAEFEVWLSCTVRALHRPGSDRLREQLHGINDSTRQLCLALLDDLRSIDVLHADLDMPLEAERLHALLDGISLHLVLQPGVTTPERARQVLTAHVDTLHI